jgi:hypothetical protein
LAITAAAAAARFLQDVLNVVQLLPQVPYLPIQDADS